MSKLRRISYLWQDERVAEDALTGVSLHSHTNQSKEALDFIAVLGERIRWIDPVVKRVERRAERLHRVEVNYARSYWTPPLTPKLAFDLESEQIARLGLRPLVSLTDHDDIHAPMLLRAVASARHIPVSVEWSVPFGGCQSFHIGVHNLPSESGQAWMERFAAFTRDAGSEHALTAMLAELHALRNVLLVFNHPMWDMYLVGAARYRDLVRRFLDQNGPYLHALELNGLRDWGENRAVRRLAQETGRLLIAGGDRHGMEPNANINLTDAATFTEFVHEIRYEGRSHVLFLPQYAEPFKHRVLRSTIDVIRDYPEFPPGSRRWDERVWHPGPDGVMAPIAELWPKQTAPVYIRALLAGVRALGARPVARGLRRAWAEPASCGTRLASEARIRLTYPEPVRTEVPRVAFFPDAFEEINGVAAIARQYTGWAARQGLPMLCIHAGGRHSQLSGRGSVERLELPRGFASFAIEKDLRYDPLWLRHFRSVERALRRFRPDVVHVTGPSDAGLMGALVAHKLGLPLVASWHTNVHEYAVKRAGWFLRRLSAGSRRAAALRIESAALAAALRLYRAARLTLAPNEELCAMLRARTGKPCLVTPAGVDAALFSPAKRTASQPEESRSYTLGFVGRLSVEKNVAALPGIAQELRRRGFGNVRFLIVGHGSEEQNLRLALPNGHFAGVLRGEALAEAFANMDCFVFPSHTDTFGMVVLEALASGVPAVVTPDGGPAHIVRASGGGGMVVPEDGFPAALGELLADGELRRSMGQKARAYGLKESWDADFRDTYAAYTIAVQ